MPIALDTLVVPTRNVLVNDAPLVQQEGDAVPRRTAPFDVEPGYHAPAKLWLYGNARLLDSQLAFLDTACGPPDQDAQELDEIEHQAEELVLAGKVIVCGVHNPAHMRAAVVPLRWGSPRVVVLSGGFTHHLGPRLDEEPFRAARLWRYNWDPKTDLAVSRRAPEKLPTFALHNPTVDRVIARIARAEWPGLRWLVENRLRTLV